MQGNEGKPQLRREGGPTREVLAGPIREEAKTRQQIGGNLDATLTGGKSRMIKAIEFDGRTVNYPMTPLTTKTS